jgi:hypothetical protein
MKTTRCVICKCEKKVVGFKKDDPILECGHILTVQDQDREIDEIFSTLIEACDDLAQKYVDVGFDRDTADKFVTVDVFGL